MKFGIASFVACKMYLLQEIYEILFCLVFLRVCICICILPMMKKQKPEKKKKNFKAINN